MPGMSASPDRAQGALRSATLPKTGWPALVALALTTLFGISVAVSAWVYHSSSPGVDFTSFWAAGRLALAGEAGLAFDTASHAAVERTVAQIGDALLPFSYPPPFLFFIAPFAFHPYWLAYTLWIGATGAFYFLAARFFAPGRYAFAHPAAVVNAMIGQNGFLTAGLFLLGTSILASHAFAGGAILGLLVIKPQLAVLIPVALLAAREWRAIAGAAVSSSVLLALAAVAFGFEVYGEFLSSSRAFTGYLAESRWKWGELASVFGFARALGIEQQYALGLQAIAAIAAGIVTWRAWAGKSENRVAILAAATLLVPPYLLNYDSLLLIAPLAWFLRDEARRWRAGVIWILLLVPLGGYFGLYPGPNTIPLAAALSLWWLHSPAAAKVQQEGIETPLASAPGA